MTNHITRSPLNRALTSEEKELLMWLLSHGKPGAETHLGAISGLRVVGGCDCGCASIDFIDLPGVGLEVISDYQWQDANGHCFGVFAFAKGGQLAGVEVWSMDGEATPTELPQPSRLVPLSHAT